MANINVWTRSSGAVLYRDIQGGVSLTTPTDSWRQSRYGTTTTVKPPKVRPLPPNNYDLTVRSVTCYVDWQYEYPLTGNRIFALGDALLKDSPTTLIWDNGETQMDEAWNRCYNTALDRLNDTYRGNLDLSIDLAEIKQTAKMTRVTEQVVDYTQTFVKRFGVVKVASKLWLQYTYGVKPLLSTIHGLAEESIRVVLNKTSRYRTRGNEKLDPGPVSVLLWNGWHNGLKTEGTGKASVSVSAFLASPEVDPGRLTSLNPVSIAWELMPYSFVIDWLYNLGGYLRGMETALIYDSQFRSGYVTKLWTYRGLIRHRERGANSYSNWDNLWSGRVRETRIIRQLLNSYPRPVLPSFEANLGSSRLISAAALLGNLLGRR